MTTQPEIEAAWKVYLSVDPQTWGISHMKAALEAAEVAAWEPMETALKDRQILVYCEARNLLTEPILYHVTWRADGCWITWGNQPIPFKPTKWRLCPSLPESI